MRRRFLVDSFAEGGAIVRGDEAHHIARVLRARPGQVFELSDGSAVWLAKVSRIERDRVEFLLVEPAAASELPLDITVLLSIFRFARFEWALEKATELGAGTMWPIAAARSEQALVEAAPKRIVRWEKIAHEAAEQSRRVAPPRIVAPTTPAKAFRESAAEVKLLLSERQDAPPMDRFRPSTRPGSVALAFGPEGGWVDEELAAARKAGFQEASLGPLILRAETAVIAALSVVLCGWASA
ncbi:MAG: 16S rRNA (uracil(1498)-N(3))-methyltransferase [Acidobacteriota bacterium]|nr:16S rRNA (uracil(1498)-N(3))-methyltransferase [Acidobacteriota bacterium]